MKQPEHQHGLKLPRRHFLGALSAAAAAGTARRAEAQAAAAPLPRPVSHGQRGIATVRGAFLYPSTESLRKQGYYSWPGHGFDAEGRHRQYDKQLTEIARRLAMRISINQQPLRDSAGVEQFINEVKQQRPDGLLLIPLKKSDWESVRRIVEETAIPTVAFATLGILLNPLINQLRRKPGVYVIASLDDLVAVEYGMRMIRTARWMRESRIVSLAGAGSKETVVEGVGTAVVALPRQRFADEFKRIEGGEQVQQLARAYRRNAEKIVEPSRPDILDAAKTYMACKNVLQAEHGDALMMDCLGGIQARLFPPPCMGFMSLRDEGIAAGCQNDLEATLTMMLLQQLFDRPGFQQNASSDTEANHYFGAHCTCPTRLSGTTADGEPYILRNHAEAGVGAVPQVLWRAGQEVTMAHLVPGKKPQMIIYSGNVVRCYNTPPAGGCRTNVEITINELDDVCEAKGMHQTIIYGNFARKLRAFCQLYGIEVVT